MNVLILMSHTGGGHRSVSLALQNALHGHAPQDVRTKIVDVFALERPALVDRATRLYGPVIRYVPRLYGWAFHFTHRPRVYRAVCEWTIRPLVPKIERLLLQQRPDLLVTTHPLCNRALVRAKEHLGMDAPIVAVVTELVTVHRSWVEPGIAHYTTATQEARDAVIALGAPPERVSVTGLPINERFGGVKTPPAELRLQMGLDPKALTLLLVGGGEGTGIERLVQAIARAELEAQLLVVCGRNERLKAKLEASKFDLSMVVFGFMETMPELMRAADVVLTKGGPQSLSEALASGRPIIVTQTLPGQEEGNAEFVERHGVGYDGRKPQRAVGAVKYLADHPGARRIMAERAGTLTLPNATSQIAKLLLDVGAGITA